MNTHQVFDNTAASQRMLHLIGELTHTAAVRTIRQLRKYEDAVVPAPIFMLINSKGGELREALVLREYIKNVCTLPVHAVVVGECSSVTLLVLLACTKRFACSMRSSACIQA